MIKKILSALGNIMTAFDGRNVSYKSKHIDLDDLMKEIHRGAERDLENFNKDMRKAMGGRK